LLRLKKNESELITSPSARSAATAPITPPVPVLREPMTASSPSSGATGYWPISAIPKRTKTMPSEPCGRDSISPVMSEFDWNPLWCSRRDGARCDRRKLRARCSQRQAAPDAAFLTLHHVGPNTSLSSYRVPSSITHEGSFFGQGPPGGYPSKANDHGKANALLAGSGHAAAAPPSSVMKSRRLMSDMGGFLPCSR